MSVIGGALVSGVGGLFILAGVKQLVTAISVSRNENIPVRDVANAEGLVEFDGRAEGPADDGPFEAPFSGEEALYCEIWMKLKSTHRTDTQGLEIGNLNEPRDVGNTETTWGLAESGDVRQPFVVEQNGTRVQVDPEGATVDISGHMGESVLGVGEDDRLPEAVRERLERLDEMDPEFDGSLDTWEDKTQQAQYREARLEPGDLAHVVNGQVERAPEGWGTGVTATVGPPDREESFMISEGTESSVVRKHLVQSTTGSVVGLVLVALGLHAIGVITLV